MLGILRLVHGQLDQTTRVGRHGGFTQLQRVHLTQTLEACDLNLAALALGLDAIKDALLFGVIQRVIDILADIHAVQRRHGNKHMAGLNQRAEMPDKQCAQQRGDVQPVRVGIGEDADLAVAQLLQTGSAGVHANGNRNIVYFLGAQHLTGLNLPGIQDLAAQRHDGLKLLVASLLGAAAGRVTLDQKEFRTAAVLPHAIGQLARQRRTLGDPLALDFLAGLETATGMADRHFSNLLADIGVLVQPQAECILDHTRNKGRGLARRQPLLGLTGELRFGHFQ